MVFKKCFIVLFMMFLFITASGQNQTDSIQIVKNSSSIRFIQSGRILQLQDMEFIMRENKMATIYLKKAKALNTFSSIVSGIGGAFIGYPIGYGISTGNFNLSLITVGCGLVIVAIPISIACKNKLKMAVNAYNVQYNQTGNLDKLDIQLGFSQNGIGLTLTL